MNILIHKNKWQTIFNTKGNLFFFAQPRQIINLCTKEINYTARIIFYLGLIVVCSQYVYVLILNVVPVIYCCPYLRPTLGGYVIGIHTYVINRL